MLLKTIKTVFPVFYVNCQLMFYSVYCNSCFFKKTNRAFYCICSSVAPLLPEIFLWLAETRKNLNIWSCIHVLDLVLKCCSDIKEDNCLHYSLTSLCWWIKLHRWLKWAFFICGSRLRLKFSRIPLLRNRWKMDSKTDFTSKILTLEVLVKIYLGLLASSLNWLKCPHVHYFFDDIKDFQYLV